MARRDDLLPEDLIEHLRRSIPGFRNIAPGHQWEVARMIWSGSTKRRRHSEVEGAMSFPAAELKEAFGRGGFERINKDLGLFRRSANWHWRQDARGATKAYWFTQKVEDALDVYLRRRWRKDVRLMWLSGGDHESSGARTRGNCIHQHRRQAGGQNAVGGGKGAESGSR